MKILASDYDGTLRTKEELSTENLQAIHDFRKAGNAFGIVTGRSMESIRGEVEKYNLEFDFIVANNGGVIYDQNFEKVKESIMDFDKALSLMEYIHTVRCASFTINNGYRRCRITVNENEIDYKFQKMNATLTIEEIMEEKKVAQMVISLHDADYAKEVADHINKEFQGYVTAFMNINCIDIVPYGVSKGAGLRFVSEWKHYPEKEIYAIGDSYNDIPMMEEFHGFCVAHAIAEIQKHAKYIVNDVHDAIAYLMKKSSEI